MKLRMLNEYLNELIPQMLEQLESFEYEVTIVGPRPVVENVSWNKLPGFGDLLSYECQRQQSSDPFSSVSDEYESEYGEPPVLMIRVAGITGHERSWLRLMFRDCCFTRFDSYDWISYTDGIAVKWSYSKGSKTLGSGGIRHSDMQPVVDAIAKQVIGI